MAILISMAPVAVASAEGLPWAALIPVALVAVAFVGYCLFDLRRASVRYLPKWAWALLCLVSIHIGVTRRRTALLPDTSQFEPWLTGREVVALARRLVAPDEPEESLDGVLRDAGLAEAASRRVCGYSRGMLQRLGLAATVVGRPELLLLDEPASALDPAGRREVLDLISRLRGHATVVLSSHILADVQEVCDAVGILRAGRLLYQGPLETLLVGRARPAYRVRVRPPAQPVADALQAEDWVTAVEVTTTGDLRITVGSLADAEVRLPRALAASGARVVTMAPDSVDLEDVFLELTS